MKLHFISGLPRSGSTLLAAILGQNPRFTAGMASPVGGLYKALESAMARNKEWSVFVTDEQRVAVLRGLFSSFYPTQTEVMFDNNRFWLARMTALSVLFPDAKMICTVRDVAWTLDSFERIYQRNPFEPSGIYGFDVEGTVYNRCGRLQAGDGVVGWALNALREALAGEQRDRILLVEYEDLCRHPNKTMAGIYSFLGEMPFVHDFSHVKFSESEFDRSLGARGLHDIDGKVCLTPRQSILPLDIFNRYAGDNFWRAA